MSETTLLSDLDRYAVLSDGAHLNWSFQTPTDYGFAKTYRAVPILLEEIHRVAATMPILFERTGASIAPVALLAFSADEGAHVWAGRGVWLANYIPCYLRLYPFAPPVADEALRFDPQSPLIHDTTTHTRFFDVETGGPSAALQKRIDAAAAFVESRGRTQKAMTAIEKANLLQPARTLPPFDSPRFDAFMAIDTKRLRSLPVHRLGALYQTAGIELAYGHVTSLQTLAGLKRISRVVHSSTAPIMPRGSTAQDDDFLDAMALAYDNAAHDDLPL